jgi:O-antigen ligase
VSGAIAQSNNNRENLLLLSIPVVMAASAVGGISIGPLRHTGLLWILTFLAACFLIPTKGIRKITFPWLGWFPLYLLLGCSLAWSDFDWRNNIQLYVQMTVFPLIGIVASYTIRSEEELASYNILYIVATLMIGGFCLYFGTGSSEFGAALYEGFADRPAATSLIAIASIFLAQIHKIPKTAIVMWGLCFGICILSKSRMATVVLLALWIVHPQLASVKARIVLVLAVVVLGLAAFNTPIIQDRFFTKKYGYAGKGTLEDVMAGKFDSAGRFDAWPIILEKSGETPWLGHGVGQSVPFVLSVWAPMDKPHNEYLKLLYEGGYLGLGFFALGIVWTLANLYGILRKTRNRNWASSAAIMAFIGFVLMAIVDNPLVYGNNFMHPVFFLVGAANGIASSLLANDSRDPHEIAQSTEHDQEPTVRHTIKPILLR